MKRVILLLAAVAATAAASAKNPDRGWGGLLMDKDVMMPGDMAELSQTQFNFGTARAMAMAGAFTSLGADLSSMSINPAGLGSTDAIRGIVFRWPISVWRSMPMRAPVRW